MIRLQTADDPRFAPSMRLYQASFPLHEQRTDTAQRAVMSHPDYHFALLYDGELFVGLLLYWEADDYCYVEHFCIEEALRGNQYGQKALALLGQAGKAVLLEIDPPVDDISIRRQGFYQRCGFVSNPYPHIHPPYQPGAQGHALVMMSYPNALSAEGYAAFVRYLDEVVMAPVIPQMRRHRQALSHEDCAQILRRGTSGVLAVCGSEQPYAVPLSYVYADGKVYFHCAKTGHKLEEIAKNPQVSFCVIDKDELHPEEYTTYYRSVILFGTARVLTDEREAMPALCLLAERYSSPNESEQARSQEISRQWERVCMVELSITRMTGKQAKELM